MKTEPFYFGSDGRLFGILDTPGSGRDPRAGVVISQPVGHEYLNCHRGCRQLALRLVERGFAVLRFDYRGCGDSLGESDDACLEEWIEDTVSAISHLRTRCATVTAIGLRFGASLVAAASVQDRGLDRVVLWEPVLRGREHLDHLRSCHDELIDRFPARRADAASEILGFTLAAPMRSAIERLELSPRRVVADRGVLIVTSSRELGRQVTELDVGLHRGVEHRQVEEPDSWIAKPAIVPAASTTAIVGWLSEPGP